MEQFKLFIPLGIGILVLIFFAIRSWWLKRKSSNKNYEKLEDIRAWGGNRKRRDREGHQEIE